MKPIHFQEANTEIKGSEDSKISDLPAKMTGINSEGVKCHYLAPQAKLFEITSMWKPTEEEINRIKAGAAVQITIYSGSRSSISPMSVTASAIFPESMIN